MSLLIRLPADVEARVQQKAQQSGLTPEDLLCKVVENAFPAHRAEEENMPKTGAELLKRLEDKGALGTFKDRPEDFARQLRETVWERNFRNQERKG